MLSFMLTSQIMIQITDTHCDPCNSFVQSNKLNDAASNGQRTLRAIGILWI